MHSNSSSKDLGMYRETVPGTSRLHRDVPGFVPIAARVGNQSARSGQYQLR
jgi:hypothetical protein